MTMECLLYQIHKKIQKRGPYPRDNLNSIRTGLKSLGNAGQVSTVKPYDGLGRIYPLYMVCQSQYNQRHTVDLSPTTVAFN
jgi:hypothetical protein